MGVTDRDMLQRQYADRTNLATRASIYAYQEPRIDFLGWALDRVEWRPGQRVLDVGCGWGHYLAALAGQGLHRLGADLSTGMAADAAGRTGVPVTAADAAALPFPDDSFDRVLAMHMLYHCPNIAAAAGELRRVLRPGGVLLAVTNGADHLSRMAEVRNRAGGTELELPFLRFSMDNGGPVLARHFESVETEEVRAELVVPDASAVVAYLDSGRDFFASDLGPGITRDGARRNMAEEVAAEIARTGAWRTPTHSGIFVCS